MYLPRGYWRHILLGVVLAACTLSAMLAASLLTGRYSLDWGVIGPAHLIFSLNPGIWEEVFHRGVMMLLLLGITKSLKWAAVIQVVVFGLAHIKGTDLVAFVDVVSVMFLAVGFTYVAYRTGLLVAGIVFHYLHDALLYVVQPAGGYTGSVENLTLYGLLWLGIAAGCLLTKITVDRLGVRAPSALYVRG